MNPASVNNTMSLTQLKEEKDNTTAIGKAKKTVKFLSIEKSREGG